MSKRRKCMNRVPTPHVGTPAWRKLHNCSKDEGPLDRGYVILRPPLPEDGDEPITCASVFAMFNTLTSAGVHDFHIYVEPGCWGANGGEPAAWVREWTHLHGVHITPVK